MPKNGIKLNFRNVRISNICVRKWTMPNIITFIFEVLFDVSLLGSNAYRPVGRYKPVFRRNILSSLKMEVVCYSVTTQKINIDIITVVQRTCYYYGKFWFGDFNMFKALKKQFSKRYVSKCSCILYISRFSSLFLLIRVSIVCESKYLEILRTKVLFNLKILITFKL